MTLQQATSFAVFTPLISAIIAGLFRNQIGRKGAHHVTILGVLVSFLFAVYLCKLIFVTGVKPLDTNLYTWAIGEKYIFHVGFLVDRLTAVMMVTVTFVSLLVHIYSMGYMAEDNGYQRFFSYLSLFTFAMLMLVTANNFLQLFFGWEGVGLVSYLLIGFWFTRESAIQGNLKAFLVNRVGDFGFILGIALVLAYTGSLHYADVFKQAKSIAAQPIHLFAGHNWSVMTVTCVLLFVGAMGKSAQVPLHVWLPESMEGPTPISALIHAATMVTAGIFMVARMSPLFEFSAVALNFVMVIGATGALFLGLVGIVQNDIKRVVAYSTLSQLGYMMVAQGASVFDVGIFHLMTHAAFKALLFLGAGSVIIAMHHEQDMTKMGGLRRYMPITYTTFLIGSLALAAIPPFSGFFSKDLIIAAAHLSKLPGAGYAYWCVTLGAFVTALYTFRALFMTFHGAERFDEHTRQQVKESPWAVTLPLVLLAIPAVILGWWLIAPVLSVSHPLFGSTVIEFSRYPAMALLRGDFESAFSMMKHAPTELPFWLSLAGIFAAWVCYIWKPAIPGVIAKRFSFIYQVLLRKFGFDDLNQAVFVHGTRKLGENLFQYSDRRLIDGAIVNGAGRTVKWVSRAFRSIQTGYVYHYATAMVLGLLVFLFWLLLG